MPMEFRGEKNLYIFFFRFLFSRKVCLKLIVVTGGGGKYFTDNERITMAIAITITITITIAMQLCTRIQYY